MSLSLSHSFFLSFSLSFCCLPPTAVFSLRARTRGNALLLLQFALAFTFACRFILFFCFPFFPWFLCFPFFLSFLFFSSLSHCFMALYAQQLAAVNWPKCFCATLSAPGNLPLIFREREREWEGGREREGLQLPLRGSNCKICTGTCCNYKEKIAWQILQTNICEHNLQIGENHLTPLGIPTAACF